MAVRQGRYVARVGKEICKKIACGATLKETLERVPRAPKSMQTFWRWLEENPKFRDEYERAKRMSVDIMEDTIVIMAQEVLKQPKFAPAYKVASEILKWKLEVTAPEKYGPKMVVEHKKTLDPKALKQEIRQLEKDLKLIGQSEAPETVAFKEVFSE